MVIDCGPVGIYAGRTPAAPYGPTGELRASNLMRCYLICARCEEACVAHVFHPSCGVLCKLLVIMH